MYAFIEHLIPPDSVQRHCNSDMIVCAVLLLIFLLVLLTSTKLRNLFGSSAGKNSPFCPKIPSDDIDLTKKQACNIASLQAAAELKDARISALERELEAQKTRLERELFESKSESRIAKAKAAADMAQKEKDMRVLASDSRRFLDPHHEYPKDMSVSIVVSLGAARGRKLEQGLQRREAALANGDLGRELQRMKKSSQDEAREFKRQIKERDSQINERDGQILQLSEEIAEQRSWIQALNEQQDELIETKMDLNRMLAQMSEALREEKIVRTELDKVVVQKNRKLEAAENKSSVLAIQLKEARVTSAIQEMKLNAASDEYNLLKGDTRRAELRADNLRRKVDHVRRMYNLLSKELDKLSAPNHHHWNDFRQAEYIKSQLEMEFGPSEAQDQEPGQSSANHEADIKAAIAREEELAGRIVKLETEIAVLKKNLTTESNTVSRHTQTEPVQAQSPCNHIGDLKVAAAKEKELAGRLGELDSENAALKKQLTAASTALKTIHEQAETLRSQMAAELHAKDPHTVTINECIDQYRNLVDVAAESAQTQGTELKKLREEYNANRKILIATRNGRGMVVKDLDEKQDECHRLEKVVADDKAEIWRQKGLITSKEAECARLRKEKADDIVEIERQIDMVARKEVERRAMKIQLTEKKEAELHLAVYLSHENFGLPVIAAVERDVLRAKAIAKEHAAAPYDGYSMEMLGQLVKCNDDIDKLRAVLQDSGAEPTYKDLRDILKDSYTTIDKTKLKQAVPRLEEQVCKANSRVSALINEVDTEATQAAVEAADRAPEEEEDEINDRIADEVADAPLRKKMLDMLMKPRGDEHQLDDVDMA